MVFYKNTNDLSEKILKIARDDKKEEVLLKGKEKYMKYFNSDLVAEYIINKTMNINSKKNFYGKIKKRLH